MANNWVVPVVLGSAAIAAVGYVAYSYLVGGQAYWQSQYTTLLTDYMKELDTYNKQQNGALTSAQEAVLQKKSDQLNQIAQNMMSALKEVFSALAPVFIGAGIGVLLKFGIPPIGRALTYYKQNGANVKNAYDQIALMRTTLNVSYADTGNVAFATASQTQTGLWASTTVYPAMEATVSALTAQLSTLTGFQLTIANYLIASFNLSVASTIPSLLSQALTLISAPPAFGKRSFQAVIVNCPRCRQKPYMVLSVK